MAVSEQRGGPQGTDDLDRVLCEAAAGDREAFRSVVITAETAVRVVLAAMLPDPVLIDDAAQETFIIAWRRIGDYRPGSDGIAWLKTIARNVALNERRRWRVRQRFGPERDALDALVEPVVDARAEGVGEEAFEAVRACVKDLGAAARDVVTRFYYHGDPVAAIADGTGRSDGWVKVVLHRARLAVARCLRAKGVLRHA